MRLSSSMRICGVVLPWALALAGCFAHSQRVLSEAHELENGALEATQEYRIGPMDELQVSVWRQPELSLDRVIVRLDGKISFPLLDDVQAAGLTPLELKSVVTRRLEEYVTAPQVTVVVRQINSKLVYALGEIAREGPIVFRSHMRVVDALSSAGGFREFAGKRDVLILRERKDGAPLEFRFDYDTFISGKNVEQNILLLPGDRIVVPPEKSFPW